LLIERKAQPGKGLMALPGGFLAQDNRKWTQNKSPIKQRILAYK